MPDNSTARKRSVGVSLPSGPPVYATIDTTELVRMRLADGRTIADADVHQLIAEIDRLKAVIRSLGGSA